MERIKFQEEKLSYKVVAKDDRYMVCIKPFNVKKTYLYTMVDLLEKIRGTDGFVFQIFDYQKEQDAKQYIEMLKTGEIQISKRNRIPLNISWQKFV